jgi:hypothetical protein
MANNSPADSFPVGRPPLSREPNCIQVASKVTPSTRAAVVAFAATDGTSVSTVVRTAVEQYVASRVDAVAFVPGVEAETAAG